MRQPTSLHGARAASSRSCVCLFACARPHRRPGPICSGRSRSSPRARSAGACRSRSNTPTTPRSPATALRRLRRLDRGRHRRVAARPAHGRARTGGRRRRRDALDQRKRAVPELHHQRRHEPARDHRRAARRSAQAGSGERVRAQHGAGAGGSGRLHGRLGGQRLRRTARLPRRRTRRWGRARPAARRSAPTAARSRSSRPPSPTSSPTRSSKKKNAPGAKRRSRTRPPGRSRCATSKAAARCSSAAATSNAGNRPPRGPPNRSSARASSAPSTRGSSWSSPRSRKRANGQAPRSAPTAAPWRGWGRRSASRRRRFPPKPSTRTTPNRCGGGSLPGSETATERVTGGSDPGNPLCVESGESALPATPSALDPCQGPFVTEQEGGQPHHRGVGREPRRRRLHPAAQRRRLHGRVPLRGEAARRGPRLRPGRHGAAERSLHRRHAPRPHARSGAHPADRDRARKGHLRRRAIADFEISADGEQVAFTTLRTQFPLGYPQYVDAPAPEPGLPELFDVDLRDGTLTRVTHGYAGGPSEQPHKTNLQEEDQYGASPKGFGALSPAFSANGETLVFTSTADNLVYGDGNTPPGDTPSAAPANGSDVFLVKPVAFPSLSTSQSVGAAPTMGTEPAWRLGVTALSRANGSVVLYVAVPAVGTLTARARGSLLVGAGGSPRAARRARRPLCAVPASPPLLVLQWARRSLAGATSHTAHSSRAHYRRRHPHARDRRTERARPRRRIDHARAEAGQGVCRARRSTGRPLRKRQPHVHRARRADPACEHRGRIPAHRHRAALERRRRALGPRGVRRWDATLEPGVRR